jgi:hypothetical protein
VSLPPDITPPAQVRQVERSVQELYQLQRDLGSVVGSNHMALTHTLGQVAGEVRALAKDVRLIDRNLRRIGQALGVDLE